MADDIIPAIETGPGAASRGAPSIGPDYRQLQSPEQVRTDLPNSGAEARAAELGNVFKEFSGKANELYTTAATQAGALAGAASGATGHPAYRQGLQRFTAFSQAFNNAATAAYAVQAEAQADDSAARLRVQANKDPAAFAATYSAARDAVLKVAPAMAVPMLTELYNKHLAANLAAITGDQLTEQRDLQGKTLSEGVARQVSRVSTLLSSDDPQKQLAAADEQVKLNLMIEGGVNSGLFSKAEAEAMHINTMRTVTEQVFSTKIDSELADPNGDVVGTMERFRQMYINNQGNPNEPAFMSHPEFDRLMSEAKQKVQQQRMLDYYTKEVGKTAEQEKYKAGDRNATERFMRGTLSIGSLADMVRNEDITPEVARTLRNQLLLGPVAHSDPKAIGAARDDPNHLDWTPDQIAALPGISNPDKIHLQSEFERERRDWQGTPEVRNGINTILGALKIPKGTERAMLSDEQRAASDKAIADYRARMQAMDPAKRRSAADSTAQEVIQSTQQQTVQAQITELSKLRDNIASVMPNWSPDQIKAYKAKQDQQITILRQQLSK